MLQGQLDSVQDLLLHLLEPTNILPGHRRDLPREGEYLSALPPEPQACLGSSCSSGLLVISPLGHQLCLAMQQVSPTLHCPAIPAVGSPSIHISPLLSFAVGKTNCTRPQASCACSTLPCLQSSITPHITSQQNYPGESICQGCLQLCGERALLQTALGTHEGR